MARRKYIKDGNPELYSYFNDETFNRMPTELKKRWTLAENFEIDQSIDIPSEVQDFMAKKEAPKKEEKPVEKPAEKPEEKKEETKTDEEVRQWYIEQLKAMGIKFAYNSKLETLKKKFEDANS